MHYNFWQWWIDMEIVSTTENKSSNRHRPKLCRSSVKQKLRCHLPAVWIEKVVLHLVLWPCQCAQIEHDTMIMTEYNEIGKCTCYVMVAQVLGCLQRWWLQECCAVVNAMSDTMLWCAVVKCGMMLELWLRCQSSSCSGLQGLLAVGP